MSSGGPPSQEATPLLIVAGVAALTAVGRILYGHDRLTVRFVIGSAIGAMVAGILLQFMCLHLFGDSTLSIYASTAIGCGGGTFTEQILRRMKLIADQKASALLDTPKTPVPVNGGEDTPPPSRKASAMAAAKNKNRP